MMNPPRTRRLRVAAIGFWHVHGDDYAGDAARHPDCDLVAVWDSDAERAAAAAERWGVPAVDDLDALLEDPDIDGVMITTATVEHDDVIARALRSGTHVFTEKLLSGTTAGAERLVEQAADAGLALTVSLPRLFEAPVRTISRLIRSGALGQITYARVRLAHDGSVAGWLPDRFYDPATAIGGALTDLGCHSVYLVQSFLGARPDSVSATYGYVTGQALEDNAVVVCAYPGGAIGVIESSNVTTPGAAAIEVRGTRGSVLQGLGGQRIIGKGDLLGEDWTEIPQDDAADGPFDLWIRRMAGESVDDPTPSAAVELTRLVVAANESSRSGARTTLTEGPDGA